jgi:hypothetical protein
MIRMELVVEDVRALSVFLSSRIVEINHEISRTAMNGTQLCSRWSALSHLFSP